MINKGNEVVRCSAFDGWSATVNIASPDKLLANINGIEKSHILHRISADGDKKKEEEIEKRYSEIYSQIADAILQLDAREFGDTFLLTEENKRILHEKKSELLKTGVITPTAKRRACSKCSRRLEIGDLMFQPDSDIDTVVLCMGCCDESRRLDEQSRIVVIQ